MAFLVIFDISSFLCHRTYIRLLDLGRFVFQCWDDVVGMGAINFLTESTLFQNVLNNLFYVICADILSVKKCTNVTKKHTNSFQRPTFAKSRNRAQTVNRKSRWEVSRNRNEVFVV